MLLWPLRWPTQRRRRRIFAVLRRLIINYAFLVTGTEPVTATTTAATYPLNYIAGVGVLEFGPYSATFGGPGVPGCSIISGEMIYLDNDYQTFQGGPQDCPSVSSLDGVPCFDGGDHVLEGAVGPGPNGSATVAFAMDFPFVLWLNRNPAAFQFHGFRRCRRCDPDRKQQYSSRWHQPPGKRTATRRVPFTIPLPDADRIHRRLRSDRC